MEIRTKKLLLRDLVLEDAEDLVESANNLNVSKYMAQLPFPFMINDAVTYIEKCNKSRKENPRTSFELGIEVISEKKIVGVTRLNSVNSYAGTATFGIWIGESYWNKFIAINAIFATLDFAFDDLQLRRIDASSYVNNTRIDPAKLFSVAGFRHEGVRRQRGRSLATGEILDENIYGLLKQDYLRFGRK